MTDLEFESRLKSDIMLVEGALISHIPESRDGQKDVTQAMKYSLINGGKRIRPVLCLEFARCCGVPRRDAVDFACAVEYIHTYSLIHDDLPCMDNDDSRRGKPSCHKQYGEALALLAGDALLTSAFQIIADSDLSDDKKADAVSLLSQNSGVCGMIGGQVLDLKYESISPSVRELLTVHKLKTGALISAACLLGCIAGGASSVQLAAASKFAYCLGIAFQIKDDILDITGDSSVLGKPVGSDAQNNKTTYATIKGVESAQNDVELFTVKGIDALKSAFKGTEFLEILALKLVERDK